MSKNIKAIQAAVELIISEGRKSFTEPEKADRADAFAMGISAIESNPQFMMQAAASHCEDWNYHHEAAVIRNII